MPREEMTPEATIKHDFLQKKRFVMSLIYTMNIGVESWTISCNSSCRIAKTGCVHAHTSKHYIHCREVSIGDAIACMPDHIISFIATCRQTEVNMLPILLLLIGADSFSFKMHPCRKLSSLGTFLQQGHNFHFHIPDTCNLKGKYFCT